VSTWLEFLSIRHFATADHGPCSTPHHLLPNCYIIFSRPHEPALVPVYGVRPDDLALFDTHQELKQGEICDEAILHRHTAPAALGCYACAGFRTHWHRPADEHGGEADGGGPCQPFPTSGAPAERRSCAWCGVRNHWHRPVSVSGDDDGPLRLEQPELAEPGLAGGVPAPPASTVVPSGGCGDDDVRGVGGSDSGPGRDLRGSGVAADRVRTLGAAKPPGRMRQLLGGEELAQSRAGPPASPKRPVSGRPGSRGGGGEKGAAVAASAVAGARTHVRQDSGPGARGSSSQLSPRTALSPGWGRDPRRSGDGTAGTARPAGDWNVWTWRTLLA